MLFGGVGIDYMCILFEDSIVCSIWKRRCRYVNTQTKNQRIEVIEVIFFPRTSETIFFEGKLFHVLVY